MTHLDQYDPSTEMIVACPAKLFSYNKRFKKAYQALYPNESLPMIYHKGCQIYDSRTPIMQQTEHNATQDIYILSAKDVQAVNSVGLEGFNDVHFFKVPKTIAYCLSSSDNFTFVSVDKDRFIIQELQKQYNIPDEVLDNIQKRSFSFYQQIHQLRSPYDSDEEDIAFTCYD